MKGVNTSSQDNQDRRLLIKTKSQQMKNIAYKGTGLNPWESDVLVEAIEGLPAVYSCPYNLR